jgi:hypothetical protein
VTHHTGAGGGLVRGLHLLFAFGERERLGLPQPQTGGVRI